MGYQWKWKNASGTKTYYAWRSMRYRCVNNPDNINFKNYYGRGIRICERWIDNYDQFYEDMGPCPERMSLDRIDNNGNYSTDNCRWANYFVQENNRRDNFLIEYKGKTQSVSQWARELNLKKNTLLRRLNIAMMPVEEAFNMPVTKSTDGKRSGWKKIIQKDKR